MEEVVVTGSTSSNPLLMVSPGDYSTVEVSQALQSAFNQWVSNFQSIPDERLDELVVEAARRAATTVTTDVIVAAPAAGGLLVGLLMPSEIGTEDVATMERFDFSGYTTETLPQEEVVVTGMRPPPPGGRIGFTDSGFESLPPNWNEIAYGEQVARYGPPETTANWLDRVIEAVPNVLQAFRRVEGLLTAVDIVEGLVSDRSQRTTNSATDLLGLQYGDQYTAGNSRSTSTVTDFLGTTAGTTSAGLTDLVATDVSTVQENLVSTVTERNTAVESGLRSQTTTGTGPLDRFTTNTIDNTVLDTGIDLLSLLANPQLAPFNGIDSRTPTDNCNCKPCAKEKKKKKKKKGPRDACFEYKVTQYLDGTKQTQKKMIACEVKPKGTRKPSKKYTKGFPTSSFIGGL